MVAQLVSSFYLVQTYVKSSTHLLIGNHINNAHSITIGEIELVFHIQH